MKKQTIWGCFLGLVASICLVFSGCTLGYTLSQGTYAAKKTENTLTQPTVTFDLTEQTFTFFYDPLSSDIPSGTIEVHGNRVTAKTEDGDRTYRFEIIDSETIRFVQNGSSPVVTVEGKYPVSDGMEFHLETNF